MAEVNPSPYIPTNIDISGRIEVYSRQAPVISIENYPLNVL